MFLLVACIFRGFIDDVVDHCFDLLGERQAAAIPGIRIGMAHTHTVSAGRQQTVTSCHSFATHEQPRGQPIPLRTATHRGGCTANSICRLCYAVPQQART
jgi:hypothetical protein